MDHRIGRAANGAVDADGIGKGRLGQDGRKAEILLDHLDDAPASQAREAGPMRIDSRIGRIARQSQTQRFDHRGHGGGSAHGHAMAGRTRHGAFRIGELLVAHQSGAHVFGEFPHVRARADGAPLEAAVEHGAA
ncbi:hypothetical protein D9M68_854850 [compost metagenome]